MRQVIISQQLEADEFAKKATEFFAINDWAYTYADGDPTPGELFAIRWNTMAVSVVRLCPDTEPLLYTSHQFIGGDLPPLNRPKHS